MKNKQQKKKRKKVPDNILAARIANRDIERMTLGDGFHAHSKQTRNKKRYTRKAKHKKEEA